ncbi:MAG TPA: CCA tRNA nucleotidyltransferase [Chlamydiales bacterium]|nr:CCA tRNA nucleotidyltransferase [Chlamydiales bacterium]
MTKEHLEAGRSVVKTLVKAGHTAYFNGGWVRDFLLKIPSDDIDIATTASPDEVQRLFDKTIPVGVAFGVVIVVIHNHHFEVATFRKDRAYIDGRRPIGIDPATPIEDAKRRDFTINGMYYDPLEEQLHDYVDGRIDLEKGIIRAIGDPDERFAEDRLRMMRAVRYAARFHFIIEDETLKAIANHASELLNAVAIERIWQEFEKMTRYPHFDTALISMHRLGLLQAIFPILSNLPLEDLEKRVMHLSRFSTEAPTIASLFELFPSSSIEQKIALCQRFKVSNRVKDFAAFHHNLEKLNVQPGQMGKYLDDFSWAKLYAHPDFDISFKVLASRLKNEDCQILMQETNQRKARLAHSISRMRSNAPILRAAHLIAAGIKPGEVMGKLLELGEKLAVNDNLNSPDQILEKLKSTDIWPM